MALTEEENNYLITCEMVVTDLKCHVEQCNQELHHYIKMVEFATKQVELSTRRYKHELKSYKLIKEGYDARK